jgi:hypothetical protein
MYKLSVATAVALSLSASVVAAQGALETDEDKTLYALGMALGSNIGQFSLSADELAVVESGLRDAVLGNEPQVDMQVYGPQIQALANSRASAGAAAERDASAAFLAQMAQEPGAERFGRSLHSHDRGYGREPDGHRHGPRSLSRHAARRHRVRQLRAAR